MKKQTPYNLFVALTVVLTSAVLLGALYFTLSGAGLGRGPTLIIDLPSVTGLRPHSQVRYAGNPVGRIVSIETLPWEQRSQPDFPIRLTARLENDLPTLKTDSYAVISADTVLAEKFLDISPGTASAPPLPEGQPVPAAPGGSMGDLMAEGGRLLADLRAMVAEVRRDYPGLRDRLTGTMESADSLLGEAAVLIDQAEGVLTQTSALITQGQKVATSLESAGPRVESLATEAEQLVRRLDAVAATADNLVGRMDRTLQGSSGGMDRSLGHLRSSLENLKVTSTYLKLFSEEISRQPWRLIWGNRRRPELPEPEEILAEPTPRPTPRNR